MRYFTRGWASGDLTDDECEQVSQAYRTRLAAIAAKLPPLLLELTRNVSLHDAVIDHIIWNREAQRLRLSVVCEHPRDGCCLIELTYHGVVLGRAQVDALRRAATSRDTELWYDEIDVNLKGMLVHRLLLLPNEEVTIEFERFDMTVTARSDWRVNLKWAFREESLDDEA